jgi:hypothetical protein
MCILNATGKVCDDLKASKGTIPFDCCVHEGPPTFKAQARQTWWSRGARLASLAAQPFSGAQPALQPATSLCAESRSESRYGSFDAGNAYKHTEALSYPRLVGTPGERRAARYIHRQLAALGLSVTREWFRLSIFPSEVGSRLIFLMGTLLAISAALLTPSWPAVSACGWALVALLVNAPWRLSGFVGRRWPPATVSANLLASLPKSPEADAPARVVFMAHYDSKSQLYPTGVRVGLVCAVTMLCLLLAILGIAVAVGFPQALTAGAALNCSIAVAVLLAVLAANVTGNRSPGALDNASGVGTLLELAHGWRPQADAPLDVVWVATGCEEAELNGARNVLERHQSWWQEKPTLLINLDSVGAGARVYLAGDQQGLGLAETAADELGILHARLRVLGAGMDHEPFTAANLPSLSILGDVVGKSLAMHSSRDNPSILERPALDRAGQLAAHIAWCWGRMHQSAARNSLTRACTCWTASSALRPDR